MFQFQTGSIRSDLDGTQTAVDTDAFQFQTGSIRS